MEEVFDGTLLGVEHECCHVVVVVLLEFPPSVVARAEEIPRLLDFFSCLVSLHRENTIR